MTSFAVYTLTMYFLIHQLTGTYTSCNVPQVSPGCHYQVCANKVCQLNPECCNSIWNINCAKTACHNEYGICLSIGTACGDKSCHMVHGSGGCDVYECEYKICSIKPQCCSDSWDSSCVILAQNSCIYQQLPLPLPSPSPLPSTVSKLLIYESVQPYQQIICSSDPCPGNQHRNSITCLCECGHINDCDGNQIFNSVLCQCGCETAPTCSSLQQFNDITCQCECGQILQCPYLHHFDHNTCECHEIQTNCPIDPCPGTQHRNHETCVCECSTIQSCSGNQQFNSVSCECQCETTPTCHAPKQFNPISCECECETSETCINGETFNQNTCQCESNQLPLPLTSPPIPSICPNGPCPGGVQQRNPKTCKCECDVFMQCPGHQSLDILCECGCGIVPECISPQQFNPILCQCECPQTEICKLPQILDPNICQCVYPNIANLNVVVV